MNNPFILSQKNGQKNQVLTKVLSTKEQEEKLNGYLEIESQNWIQIKYGTHIRYYTKSGEFRTGGFVVKNPLETVNPDSKIIKIYIKLQNGFNKTLKGYYEWIISYDEISKIYSKLNANELTTIKSLENAVIGLNENIRKLVKHAKSLESRIDKLESSKSV